MIVFTADSKKNEKSLKYFLVFFKQLLISVLIFAIIEFVEILSDIYEIIRI